MADVLTRCIKCKESLLAPDKTSKLLPCLHTMCDDCISGRTDAADQVKRIKDEHDKCIEEKYKILEETCETSNSAQEISVDQKTEAKDDQSVDAPSVKEKSDEITESEPKHDSESLVLEGGHTASAENESAEASDGKATEAKTDDAKESFLPAISRVNILTVTDKFAGDQTGETTAGCDDESAKEDRDENKEESNDSKVDAGESSTSMDTSSENTPMETETAGTSEESVKEEEPPPKPVPLHECPVCREPFVPESLVENVFIRKKVVVAEDEEGKEQKCTGCESNPASCYCLQCDDWLCADCVKAHKRVRMTKDHQLTSKEEAAEVVKIGDNAGPAEVDMLCRVHPKEKLTLFCEKCELLTCRDCQLLQHQEHKYQFLQEAAESYKAKLTGSLSLMKERRDVLRKYQTEIEDRLNKVRREKEELQQDILKQADAIVKAVRAAVWQVLSSLHSFTDAAAKRLSREVGDVGDLVGKFDHCIMFMDGILADGFGVPLLFTKSLVETKCRKVYHTHMEPQSLKGQLNIQYRHDVPSVLRSLPNIGAIYVNGSKYPPEKPSPQPSPASLPGTAGYRSANAGAPNVVVGPATTGTVSHHLAPQDRSAAYMQMFMNRQPQNSGSSPALTLPGSRRLPNMAPQMANAGNSRPWPNQLVPGLAVSMAGILGQGQGQSQAMLAPRSSFTPMRLHHRPMDQSHLPNSAPTMVLGAPSTPHRSQQLGVSPHLPAPPPLRPGQPHYRGDAEGGSGAQAALSGLRRSGLSMDGPDPARPASGHTTPERPHSSEGAASSVRVKSEPHDNTDCVITSASFKGKKSPAMPAQSLGDLQKNLDEVIRGVPLDLGDNLEQINGDSLSLPSITKTTTPPSASSNLSTSQAEPAPSPPKTASPTVHLVPATRNRSSEDSNKSKSPDPLAPPPAHSDSPGHQVRGLTTGNSMPGFSMEAAEAALADPNDDYCAVCHQGGDVLCCDQCPRVFHLNCHVPALPAVPSGTFVCTLCEPGLVLEGHEGSPGPDQALGGKRKAPTGLSDRDLKVCERILLELYCHPSSIPFHEPVNRNVPNYYRIITNPMDFNTIKCKVSRTHFNHYPNVEAFIDEVKLVFRNCAVYNAETSEVGKAGKKVRETFLRLVDRHMPEYSAYARKHDLSETVESERKKRKVTPPPNHKSGSHNAASHAEKVADT